MMARWMAAVALLAALCGCGGGDFMPQARAQGRPALIVVIGDSITAGYMAGDGARLQLRQERSYVAALRPLGDVRTAAVAGATTEAALRSQVPWLGMLPADVVVVMLGTNDALTGAPRSKSLDNVRRIAAAWPRARIVLVSPPMWEAAQEAWLAPWAADLAGLSAELHGAFVDVHAMSLTHPDWYCDALDRHPCEAAHKDIGQAVGTAIGTPTTRPS